MQVRLPIPLRSEAIKDKYARTIPSHGPVPVSRVPGQNGVAQGRHGLM